MKKGALFFKLIFLILSMSTISSNIIAILLTPSCVIIFILLTNSEKSFLGLRKSKSKPGEIPKITEIFKLF